MIPICVHHTPAASDIHSRQSQHCVSFGLVFSHFKLFVRLFWVHLKKGIHKLLRCFFLKTQIHQTNMNTNVIYL